MKLKKLIYNYFNAGPIINGKITNSSLDYEERSYFLNISKCILLELDISSARMPNHTLIYLYPHK